jgi:hypothetical protein
LVDQGPYGCTRRNDTCAASDVVEEISAGAFVVFCVGHEVFSEFRRPEDTGQTCISTASKRRLIAAIYPGEIGSSSGHRRALRRIWVFMSLRQGFFSRLELILAMRFAWRGHVPPKVIRNALGQARAQVAAPLQAWARLRNTQKFSQILPYYFQLHAKSGRINY